MKYAEVEAIVKQAIDKHQKMITDNACCCDHVLGTDLDVDYIADVLYDYSFDKAVALAVWKKLEGINDRD